MNWYGGNLGFGLDGAKLPNGRRIYTVLWLYTTGHYTALLHYTALHCTELHYTALHCTELHYTVLHYTAPLHRGILLRI